MLLERLQALLGAIRSLRSRFEILSVFKWEKCKPGWDNLGGEMDCVKITITMISIVARLERNVLYVKNTADPAIKSLLESDR